jgi:hypothetical protein
MSLQDETRARFAVAEGFLADVAHKKAELQSAINAEAAGHIAAIEELLAGLTAAKAGEKERADPV